MRAVALSDAEVQARIARWFVPLKVVIELRTKRFPLDWPAMRGWRAVYDRMGGEACEGITFCSVVSPDLQVEYANTGSAMVWEMFDSIAYDATKFGAMLDRGALRARAEREIRGDETRSSQARDREIAWLRRRVARAMRREGRFRLPPWGFTVKGAVELFKLTGDLTPDGKKAGLEPRPRTDERPPRDDR